MVHESVIWHKQIGIPGGAFHLKGTILSGFCFYDLWLLSGAYFTFYQFQILAMHRVHQVKRVFLNQIFRRTQARILMNLPDHQVLISLFNFILIHVYRSCSKHFVTILNIKRNHNHLDTFSH